MPHLGPPDTILVGRQVSSGYNRADEQHGCSGTRSVRIWTIAVELYHRYSVRYRWAGRSRLFFWLTSSGMFLSRMTCLPHRVQLHDY